MSVGVGVLTHVGGEGVEVFGTEDGVDRHEAESLGLTQVGSEPVEAVHRARCGCYDHVIGSGPGERIDAGCHGEVADGGADNHAYALAVGLAAHEGDESAYQGVAVKLHEWFGGADALHAQA